MRTVFALAAFTLAAAGPVWAQSHPLVTGPRTLTPAHVACTDLPAATRPAPTRFIKGGHNTDGHQSLVKGEVAVLTRSADDGLQVGQRFFVRRVQGGPSREFPREGEGWGMVHTAGWVTVTGMDEYNALASVDYTCDSIETGDYLEPYVEVVLPTSADPAGAPIYDDRASILFGTDTRTTFGDGDTLSIDRGTVHGVKLGARFMIFRNIQYGLPLVWVGDAVVMEQGELTSKVVLVLVKDVVQRGDVVVPRRVP
jgi:hypothetical protein